MTLTSLRRIYASTIPKFGVDNLKHLVYGKQLSSIVALKNCTSQVLAGVTYRFFDALKAVEVCLCATSPKLQRMGIGLRLMYELRAVLLDKYPDEATSDSQQSINRTCLIVTSADRYH
ncbi:hypothetical protein AAMO2058_000274800 [Amorphochlora amoebiformis]